MEAILEKHRQEVAAAPETANMVRNVTSAASSFVQGFSAAMHQSPKHNTKTPAPTGADAM
jgi:hypothetical protein